MAETVGFIGLGIMGKPMAENLIEAGYDLVAYNRTREKAEELEGAPRSRKPRERSRRQSDIIITMLPDSPQVEEVLAGEDGVLEGIKEGALHRGHEHDLARRHRGAFGEGPREGRLDARRAGLWW